MRLHPGRLAHARRGPTGRRDPVPTCRSRAPRCRAAPGDGPAAQVAVADSSAPAAAADAAPSAPEQQQLQQQKQQQQPRAAAEAPAAATAPAPAGAPAPNNQPGSDESKMQLTASVISSIDQVSQEEWDAVACGGGEVNPFVTWKFLWILEASGSAAREEGWGPQHVVVRDEAGRLVGCCPLYLKGHSYGEYVFDSSWAQFYQMNVGRPYYPKLQCCVPFTPVTGPRLMAAPGPYRAAITKALAETLVAVTDRLGVSSLHVTFAEAEEWAAMGALGMQQRRGIQYHWENDGYTTFEDFLAALKQSKRKSIRQERKAVAKQGLTVWRLTGAAITQRHWERFYEFYLNTVDKRWGSAYLTRKFFEMLGSEMADQVLLVVAEDEAGEMVAGALNMIGSHALFGRNWGCVAGKEWKGLHFECCYYQAIEEAIERGLPRVEAGAQGEHKMQRGYLPNYTYSAHYCRDPVLRSAVGRFLEREAQQINYTWQTLTLEASPFKKERTLTYVMDKISAFSSLSSGSSLDGWSMDAGDKEEGTQ